MTQAVYVEDGKVKKGPKVCPKNWKNISGFELLPWSEKNKHGWFEAVVEQFNQKFYDRSEPDIQDDKVFYTKVPKDIDVIKKYLKDRLADLRWRKEIGGFTTADGLNEVITDERSQTKMLGVLLGIITNMRITGSKFKFKDGFKPKSNEEMTSLCAEVFAHIQGLYDKEDDKIIEIDALTTVEECITYHDTMSEDWFPVDENITIP